MTTERQIDSKRSDVTRRHVLKTAGGVGIATFGIAGATGSAAAEPDPAEFSLGTVPFVEVKEEYPDATVHPETDAGVCRYKFPDYVVEPSESRLVLTTGATEALDAGDAVVAADGKLYGAGTEFPLTNEKYVLPVETDYSHLNSRYVTVGSGHAADGTGLSPSRLGNVQADGDTARFETSAVSANVTAGQEAVVGPNGVSVRSRSGSELSATQRISIRHHGEVEVFGHEEYQLYPTGTANEFARQQVATLRNVAPEKASTLQEVDLVAIPKDADVSPGRNGGGGA